MLERFDESELLALIEGELDPAATGRLEQALAADPAALELVRQMQADRRALRSLGDPVPPVETLAAIEPLIARPILVETEPFRPGAYRRQHRSRARRRQWIRSGVAAAAIVTIIISAWATITSLAGRSAPPAEGSVAENRANAPGIDEGTHTLATTGASDPAGERSRSNPLHAPAGTTFHHRWSRPAGAADHLAAASPSVAPTPPPAGTSPTLHAASFTLVIRSEPSQETESVLAETLASLTDRSALVRNLTYAEAWQIERAWRAATASADGARPRDGRRDRDAPMANSASPASDLHSPQRLRDLARLVRERRPVMPRPTTTTGTEAAQSGIILGSRSLLPSYEQQLDYSLRGAAYTLAVPLSRLPDLLAHLHVESRLATTLRLLPAEDETATESGSDPTAAPARDDAVAPSAGSPLRLSDLARIRQMLASLRAEAGDDADQTIVLLPVIVER